MTDWPSFPPLLQALFSSQRGSFQSLYLRSLYTDDRYKLAFEDDRARQAFDGLLVHQCPRCSAGPFGTFRQLQDHVTSEHDLFYCELCVTHLKVGRVRVGERMREGRGRLDSAVSFFFFSGACFELPSFFRRPSGRIVTMSPSDKYTTGYTYPETE